MQKTNSFDGLIVKYHSERLNKLDDGEF
jgi:hypothetical protein